MRKIREVLRLRRETGLMSLWPEEWRFGVGIELQLGPSVK
jgi:hypothetical protein